MMRLVAVYVCVFTALVLMEPVCKGDGASTPNVITGKQFDATVLEGVAENSLAARIVDRRHSYSWRPQWISGGVNGVRLPGFAISRDKSVLAVIETVGEVNGPFGSRIVFFSTANWKVIRVLEFDRERFTGLCFLARHDDLLAVMLTKQSIWEQKSNRLMLLDMLNGRIIGDVAIPDGKAAVLAVGKFLAVKPEMGKEICIYEVGGRDEPLIAREKVMMGVGEYLLAGGDDSKSMVAGGNGKLSTVDLASGEVVGSMELAAGTEIAALTVAGGMDSVALALGNGRTFLYEDKIRKELGTKGGGTMEYDAGAHSLWVLNMGGQMVTPWSLKTMMAGKEMKPGGMVPKTMGHIVFWSVLTGDRLLFCSSFGDIMEIYHAKNSWRKKLVVSALR